MARVLGLFPSALLAAKGGLSANAYYRELRDLGIAARRGEVLSLFKLAKGIVTRAPEEPFRDIYAIPNEGEIGPWPSKGATGIIQRVSLTYRDRTTGEIKQTYWSTVTENGLTREAAIATAIDAYSEHAESYEQDLIGAVHTSVYRLTPTGF